MSQVLPQCQNLQEQVERLLQLLHQEPSLRTEDTTAVKTSLAKAISPKFEIVFAGAFSAGKSMLINALLERELLYSAEGHATGTECYIAYAEPNEERVVLTFLSEAEIREQATKMASDLRLGTVANINQTDVIDLIREGCDLIIQTEGGEAKSERAKQAKALILLMEGFVANRDRIHTIKNEIYSMEQFNFSNLKEAASFARRGSNSAVLKKIEYYCNHPLLKDGNVIIDTPGIDAPVEKDAQLTYNKIEHPDTSAVVCVLKAASSGELTTEETKLLEKTRDNAGIRDRVFYIFNRIDETWFKPQLRQRLEGLLSANFQDTSRVYKTSGLLGFYGGLIRKENADNHFGLDTIFAESVQREGTPGFVQEFNHYCAAAGKLPNQFRVTVHGFETPNENYVRILNEWGTPLINQLISDSGIEEFRNAITRYFTEEKRPQLFGNLADDLDDICLLLKKQYETTQRNLDSEPREIDAMKSRELEKLNQELQEVGRDYCKHITDEVTQSITNADPAFESDFQKLQQRMIHRLDELISTFSVADAYRRSVESHPRNGTAPFIAVLVEALYYLSNQLEDILVESALEVNTGFFQRLQDRVRKSDYYRKLNRLLGNDGGIEKQLKLLEEQVTAALINEARSECDRYVRETPSFYNEGTFSIYQFRQTLLQTSEGYGCESIIEAEPAIRQLLKLDFEPKVKATIRSNFRQIVNNTIKTQLNPATAKQADDILLQYPQARAYLEQTLEQEAEEKIAQNRRLQGDIEQKIETYNQTVNGINSCLQAMGLYQRLLPDIAGNTDVVVDAIAEVVAV